MNDGLSGSLVADRADRFPLEADLIQKHAALVETSYNNCRATSHKLANDLLSNGIRATVMRCSGLLTDAPDADQRWLELGPQGQWVHFVVKTDSQMVDLTRQQFFPLSGNPFFQTLGNFSDEWTAIRPDEFSGRMRRK